MSLTAGTAPFGPRRAGRFDVEVPDRVVYVEPFPRRVRAVLGGATVIDSDDAVLVHETGSLPRYAFPAGHVHIGSEREEHVDGHVRVAWTAVDAWYEEDERVEVHPRDPYHRVDVFATSRRVTVSVDGTVLAESTRAMALYETSLPVRYYLPPADVHLDLLRPSPTMTECPYKGTARYWHATVNGFTIGDVAWEYRHHVRREAEPVQGRLAFFADRVDVTVAPPVDTR